MYVLITEIIKSIILGIIQGITEWLPISSTGHMILFDELIPMNLSKNFMDMFFVVIQLASVFAVILIYFNKLNPFSRKKSAQEKKDTWDIWFKVLIGIIPVGIIGFLFKDPINDYFYNWMTVAFTLILYGILFIIIENRNKKRETVVESFNELSYGRAFQIGMFQVLSLIPGTSRSGSTIMGGLICKVSRSIAAEFSFFMSIPVMLGASLVQLGDFGWSFSQVEGAVLLIGMIVSFVVSYYAIKFLIQYIQKNDFKPFGWYRIILGIVVILYFGLRV